MLEPVNKQPASIKCKAQTQPRCTVQIFPTCAVTRWVIFSRCRPAEKTNPRTLRHLLRGQGAASPMQTKGRVQLELISITPKEKITMRITRYIQPASRGFAPVLSFSRNSWTGLQSEIDRLFETALTDFASAPSARQFPVDLYEDKDHTYVRAELPGVNREDINVEMTEGYLTITAARKTPAAGAKAKGHFLSAAPSACPRRCRPTRWPPLTKTASLRSRCPSAKKPSRRKSPLR